jgi:hypothetical protein
MNNLLSISDTEQGRAFWLGQGLARQHLERVSAADVLIVPLKDFREGVPFVFHQDTAGLFHFLANSLDGQATIEVVADDDEYMELALHSASHRFSTIIVNYVLAPLVINLLSNYLYDTVKAKPGDSVELNIVIEDHECRSMRVGFKGEAKDFALIADKVGQISRDCLSAARAHENQHAATHHVKLRADATEPDVTSAPNMISRATSAKLSPGLTRSTDVEPVKSVIHSRKDSQKESP